MRKGKALLFISVLIALSFGCDQKEPASSGARGKGQPAKPRIALIMKSLANEFFKTMEDGAKAHQKEHDSEYELMCSGIKDEQDVNKQIDIVNQMAAQRVDAIVIAPADSKALVSVCKKAMDNGIVVINIDNKFDETVLAQENIKIPFVGPNNRKGARMAGEYLAKRLERGDKVAIIEGRPGAFNAIQRKLGFEDAMKKAGMEIVASQSAYWETDKAYKLVDQIYNKFGGDLKAVLCANDSMALGAERALKGKGVKIVGFDNISAVQTLIKEGRVICTIDQHADQIAVEGIKYALEVLRSKGTPEDKETPVDLITAESLK